MSRLSVIEEKFSFLADWSLSDERRSVSKDDCSIFDEIMAIIERMIKDAETLGADAVVNVRLTTSMIMQGVAEILAYGTAVKLKH